MRNIWNNPVAFSVKFMSFLKEINNHLQASDIRAEEWSKLAATSDVQSHHIDVNIIDLHSNRIDAIGIDLHSHYIDVKA